jgi:3-hydroxybutyryl-CoA dehydrogenase
MAHPIGRVFVAGAGLMGHGIAQVHAAIGKTVVLYEPDLTRAEAGRDRIAANLERAVTKGRLTAAERDAIVARIEPTANLVHVADADLVIEAVFEDVKVKTGLWRELDVIAPEPAVFASNTSSIAIHRLADAVSRERRERFAGMHFFSPVPVMPLIELIRGRDTSDETMTTFSDLAAALGKQVIVSADRPGFIVNRILMPFLAEAMRAFEEGVGTADDIDAGARIGLNHPMGPLELADFIGLDVCLGIMRVLDDGFGGDHFRPPRVLTELVLAGKLGQKSGEGFHTYPRPERPASGTTAG